MLVVWNQEIHFNILEGSRVNLIDVTGVGCENCSPETLYSEKKKKNSTDVEHPKNHRHFRLRGRGRNMRLINWVFEVQICTVLSALPKIRTFCAENLWDVHSFVYCSWLLSVFWLEKERKKKTLTRVSADTLFSGPSLDVNARSIIRYHLDEAERSTFGHPSTMACFLWELILPEL